MTNNETEHTHNSERDKRNKESNRTHSKQCVKTKATNNKTEHIRNSTRDSNVKNSQTEHREKEQKSLT